MGKYTANLVEIGLEHLCGRDPEDPSTSWVEAVENVSELWKLAILLSFSVKLEWLKKYDCWVRPCSVRWLLQQFIVCSPTPCSPWVFTLVETCDSGEKAVAGETYLSVWRWTIIIIIIRIFRTNFGNNLIIVLWIGSSFGLHWDFKLRLRSRFLNFFLESITNREHIPLGWT